MPSSLIHGLFPASCAAYEAPTSVRLRRFVLAIFIANFPDLDIAIGLCFPDQFNAIHRNFGHNLFVLPLWIALGAYVLKRWGGMDTPKRWLVAAALVLSHLMLDAMTVHQEIAGTRSTVPLLWPVSDWGFEFPWQIFEGVPPQQRYHNPLIDRVWAYQFWAHTIFKEIFWTFTFAAIWILPRHLRHRLRRNASPLPAHSPNELAS